MLLFSPLFQLLWQFEQLQMRSNIIVYSIVAHHKTLKIIHYKKISCNNHPYLTLALLNHTLHYKATQNLDAF